MNFLYRYLVLFSILLYPDFLHAQLKLTKDSVIGIIEKVNDHWQSLNPEPGNAFWNRAVYQTGNMAAYKATGVEKYRLYSEKWAERNLWKGAKSEDTSRWKYKYGETDDYVLFGDWQACFQVYAELYKLKPEDYKISRARQVMEYEMSTSRNDYWWWVDGLYMVMPVMTELYSITRNELYLQKLYEYFSFTRNLIYDKESGLFYRDAKYILPKHTTARGLKDFWSRGNGWVFAAIPRVLEDLPKNDPHWNEYIRIFKDMAKTLAKCQQQEGYWTRSLLDSEQAPGPETSGTSFFTYGFLWGMNHGILKKKTYLPVVEKSWKYLTEIALQPDGKVGYIQPIGEKAIPGQMIDKNSTSDFGVGTFLLAASEMVRFVK